MNFGMLKDGITFILFGEVLLLLCMKDGGSYLRIYQHISIPLRYKARQLYMNFGMFAYGIITMTQIEMQNNSNMVGNMKK